MLLAGFALTLLLFNSPQPSLAQRDKTHSGGKGEKISSGLKKSAHAKPEDTLSVLVQLSDKPSGKLRALLNRNGVHLKGDFESLGSMALDLPASAVAELAALGEVSFIDNDNDTQVLGHVTTTAGAEQMRTQSGTSTKLDGTGIGIAILDSGLYTGHKAFNNYSKKSRVVYSQDFTGEKRVDDVYGHGTFVTAAAAGNGDAWSNKYTGIAPNAKIINLRVSIRPERAKSLTCSPRSTGFTPIAITPLTTSKW
jgi:subtilisin family serine protease